MKQNQRSRGYGRTTARNARREGPLKALQPIETLPDTGPFAIVPVEHRSGSVMSPEEVMDARVQWAVTVKYTVLTRDVPKELAPYNAIIRLLGTEDRQTDYLAVLEKDGQSDD